MPQTETPQTSREKRRRKDPNLGHAPNARPRDRGSRQDDPKADSILPGREFGAGGQVDDGPPPRGI